jgi:hypothetical protein
VGLNPTVKTEKGELMNSSIKRNQIQMNQPALREDRPFYSYLVLIDHFSYLKIIVQSIPDDSKFKVHENFLLRLRYVNILKSRK